MRRSGGRCALAPGRIAGASSFITVGTGIGAAALVNGRLPNTEPVPGMPAMVAEHCCSDAVRKRGSFLGPLGQTFQQIPANCRNLCFPGPFIPGSAKLDKFIDGIGPVPGRRPRTSTRPAS